MPVGRTRTPHGDGEDAPTPQPHLLGDDGPQRVVFVDENAVDVRHGSEPIARYHTNTIRLDHLIQQI